MALHPQSVHRQSVHFEGGYCSGTSPSFAARPAASVCGLVVLRPAHGRCAWTVPTPLHLHGAGGRGSVPQAQQYLRGTDATAQGGRRGRRRVSVIDRTVQLCRDPAKGPESRPGGVTVPMDSRCSHDTEDDHRCCVPGDGWAAVPVAALCSAGDAGR